MSRDKRLVFEELLLEVRRSQAATARFDQAVADAAGLNRTDMSCIDVISREGSLTAGQLAEATGLSTGAMTTALDRLERSGFARRIRDPADRRRVLVELTEQAQQLHDYYAGHMALSERLYHAYTAEQMELLLDWTRRGREFNEQRAQEVERETGHGATAGNTNKRPATATSRQPGPRNAEADAATAGRAPEAWRPGRR